jgi:hypothetical protein
MLTRLGVKSVINCRHILFGSDRLKDLGADGAIILKLDKANMRGCGLYSCTNVQKLVRTALFWVVTQRVVVMYSGTSGDGLVNRGINLAV